MMVTVLSQSIGTLLSRGLLEPDQARAALTVGADPTNVKAAHGSLLAVLASLMDEDYYADTRSAALHAVSQLLKIVKRGLSYEQRRFLYPELVKRLDDPR